MASLEEVLRRARADAEVLRRHGDARLAVSLEQLANAVEQSDEARLLEWISETDAQTITGRGIKWLRGRRREWEQRDLARKTSRGWRYRRVVLPQADRVEASAESRFERALRDLNA